MALTLAFVVNAAILVLAAIVFYGKDSVVVAAAGGQVFPGQRLDPGRAPHARPAARQDAGRTLFAVALLASGQSSTITGTLAGQVVMEGFMHWRIKPWVRRLGTRMLAVIPAILIVSIRGDSSITDLVNLSQVVLCLELPLAMFPLLHLTSSRKRMGQWRSGWFLLITGWVTALLITVMDLYSLPDALKQAWAVIAGH